MSVTIGIDISKHHLHVALREHRQSGAEQCFANTQRGHTQLVAWIQSHAVTVECICMEATGRYGEQIAHHLHENGYGVSIVTPSRTSHFARSLKNRHKTDFADARMLAQFAAERQPSPWKPPRTLLSNLRDLKRLLDNLIEDRTRIRNRLEGMPQTSPARPYLEKQLQYLEKQITDVENDLEQHIDNDETLTQNCQLLTSINGIGAITARQLLAEIADWTAFDSAKELVAFAGLCPQHIQSGTMNYSRLSKRGNARIRKTLYLPALTAMRYNPHLKRFADRLLAHGKAKMQVVVAVMRKLLVLAYAIIKSGIPYDPDYQVSA